MLWLFYEVVQPDFPLRHKRDVQDLITRWEGLSEDHDDIGNWTWEELEQDLHALAAVAMEALPD